MNASFVRRATAFLFLSVALLAMFINASAQTARPRPKVVTNDPAAYRYSYQHGYRAGYEDGFTKGKSDFNENQPRDFSSSDAYNRADRGYEQRMGTLAEFQESYRVGFELGYGDGYFGRPFTVSIPPNLGKVVIASVNANNAPVPAETPATSSRPRSTDTRDPRAVDDRPANRSSSRASITIPDGVQMKIRLTSQISTKTNREGDRFQAVVLDPSEYADAVIEGHIAKLNRSGKATGKTELALAFDSISMRDGRSGRFAAQIERVYESETVKTVDEEGNVETGSRTKDTATRSAGGAVLGAIIGGIAGGGKGAAIGAAIGAGVGVGSVFIQGGKDLILDPGTEILIRTAAPARERD
jgi:hypothetical protein